LILLVIVTTVLRYRRISLEVSFPKSNTYISEQS